MIERTWYYYRDTLQEGPIAESTLRSMIANGGLPNDVLVYCAELSQEWNLASDVETFQNLGSSTAHWESVPRPVQTQNPQQFIQRKKTQKFAQPSSNTTQTTAHPQPSQRLARPRIQQPTAPTVQSSSPAVQTPPKKKDDDSAMGCGFLIAIVSVIPHLQFLLILAGIFVFIGCCKHLARWEIKKAWDGLLGLFIVYGFSFVVAKIIEKIYGLLTG